MAPKTFYAGDKELKAGTLVERPGVIDAQSSTLYENQLYYRFPFGAYRTQSGATGCSEVRTPKATALTAMGLHFSGNYELIGYALRYKSPSSNADNSNMETSIVWANGWGTTLPYGTYRFIVKLGSTEGGGVQVRFTLGGVAHNTNAWQSLDVTVTGSGYVSLSNHIPSRANDGWAIMVFRVG